VFVAYVRRESYNLTRERFYFKFRSSRRGHQVVNGLLRIKYGYRPKQYAIAGVYVSSFLGSTPCSRTILDSLASSRREWRHFIAQATDIVRVRLEMAKNIYVSHPKLLSRAISWPGLAKMSPVATVIRMPSKVRMS
jgi:hypothetical protein